MQIVFHVNQPEHWNMALNNIQNVLTIDSTACIELVVHGAAVSCITKSAIDKSQQLGMLNELHRHKVIFAVCNNTLTKMKISEKEIFEQAIIVLAGVYEIAIKQKQGYCYIKP
ncbi:DsrE family protein [Shewanella sp. 125m-7]